jgi:glycerol-3-phosphate dehydrogenase
MTWFRIWHGGERYLHTGSRSLGCITIVDTERWMEICNTLIKALKGDFMSVGVIEVID